MDWPDQTARFIFRPSTHEGALWQAHTRACMACSTVGCHRPGCRTGHALFKAYVSSLERPIDEYSADDIRPAMIARVLP